MISHIWAWTAGFAFDVLDAVCSCACVYCWSKEANSNDVTMSLHECWMNLNFSCITEIGIVSVSNVREEGIRNESSVLMRSKGEI